MAMTPDMVLGTPSAEATQAMVKAAGGAAAPTHGSELCEPTAVTPEAKGAPVLPEHADESGLRAAAMDGSMVEAAVQYGARLGWTVFPCHGIRPDGTCTCRDGASCKNSGKHPCEEGWQSKASADEADISRAFARYPNSNIGLACGNRSGVFVLDVDGPEGLDPLKGKHLPQTPVARTGSGGLHYYYRYRGSGLANKVKFAPGLDTRAEGGLVILPPSRHATGNRYEWCADLAPWDLELAPPPSWLIEALTSDSGGNSPAPPIGDVILEGQRNDKLLSLAGTLRRRGLSTAEMLPMLRAVNESRCRPPLEDREVADIAASVERYAPAETRSHGDDGKQGTRKGAGDAQIVRLLRIVEESGLELFVSPEGEPFAHVPCGDHHEVLPLRERGTGFRSWLVRRYCDAHSVPPNPAPLQRVIEGQRASAEVGKSYPVAVRIAKHGGRVYLDLGRPDWRVVEIDENGWRLVTKPPVRFRRPPDQHPLPIPAPEGDLRHLLPFLEPLESDEDRILATAWALGALQPDNPFAILAIVGEQGACKTTIGRALRMCVDPVGRDGRGLLCIPRDVDTLITQARNRHVLAWDNVSFLSPWLSDALSATATGVGHAKRQLYTDGDEAITYVKAPVILTGIPRLCNPRRSGRSSDRRHGVAHARGEAPARARPMGRLRACVAFGTRRATRRRELCDSTPTGRGGPLPADGRLRSMGHSSGTRVLVGARRVPGSIRGQPQEHGRRYRGRHAACATRAALPDANGVWEGTAGQLHYELSRMVDKERLNQDWWPKDATRRAGELRRLAPAIRAERSVAVTFSRANGVRTIRLQRIAEHENPGEDEPR